MDPNEKTDYNEMEDEILHPDEGEETVDEEEKGE